MALCRSNAHISLAFKLSAYIVACQNIVFIFCVSSSRSRSCNRFLFFRVL